MVKQSNTHKQDQVDPRAYLVAEFIRKHVPRPMTLPRYGNGKFTIGCLVFYGEGVWPEGCEVCPLGLIGSAIIARPFDRSHFRGRLPFDQSDMLVFVRWWDKIRNPREAMRMVWGE